jgi:CubicO group peptidase (beta-lactamase class C family)
MRSSPHLGALLALVLAAGACAPRRPPAAAPAIRGPGSAAAADSLLSALDAGAPGWLAAHRVPSLAVAYVRDGRVAWTRVYGEQSAGVPAGERTLYNVASLAKPVFAETVLRLAAAGRLSLDEPLAAHWTDPDVAADPRHRKLTPRLALSHRTGFPNWRYQDGGTLRFRGEPGAAYGYSGEGFEYASRFAGNKLGAPLDSLAKQYVFGPVGMTSTSFSQRDWFAGRIALPLGPEGRYGEPSLPRTANAADDLYTTVGDYAAFLVAVMNRDGLPAAYARQRDSIHVLDTGEGSACDPARVARCPGRIGYGLGWSVMEYADETVLWHTGSDWGEKAMVFYLPGRRDGAVLLTNGASGFQVILEAAVLLARGTDFAEYLRSKAGG